MAFGSNCHFPMIGSKSEESSSGLQEIKNIVAINKVFFYILILLNGK
jgi:hypothetical protein